MCSLIASSWYIAHICLFNCRLRISVWDVRLVFPFEYIPTKQLHCGIAHPKYFSGQHGMLVQQTSGRWVAFLPKWSRVNHSFKVIPKSISCSECSGNCGDLSNVSVMRLIRKHFLMSRILKTPTEEIWPGVTQLQDYKTNFPCWNQIQLKQQVKYYDVIPFEMV